MHLPRTYRSLSRPSSPPRAKISTPVAGSVNSTTVTVHVSFNDPSTVVTVITAVPKPTGVTLPSASTVTTCVLLDDHVTALFDAFAGNTVGVNLTGLLPSTRFNLSCKITLVTR